MWAVQFPDDDEIAPVRIRVTVSRPGRGEPRAATASGAAIRARAEAELAPAGGGLAAFAQRRRLQRTARLSPGQADAPRRGDRLRPHGGGRRARRRLADDHQRLPQRRRAGASCSPRIRTRSGSRRPATSLHRLGTELDLGPPGAYGWLAAQRDALRLLKRYAWEPWHFGYTLNPGSRSVGFGGGRGRRRTRAACRRSCPPRFAPAITRAASAGASRRRCCRPALRRVGLQPVRRQPRRRAGIAQFMPGTAAAYGLRNPFDAERLDRRPGAPDARPAAPLRLGPARARRLQRGPGRGRGPAAASRPTRRPAATSPASSACSPGAGNAGALSGLAVRLVK